MINRVVLVGRLTRDPELRKTNNDKPVASFTLAVDNRQKTQDGKKTASFIPITVWNDQATNVCKYVRKGSLVGVEGRIQQRTYDKKDGTKANVLEVVADSVQFLEPKGSKGENIDNNVKEDVSTDTSDTEKNMEGADLVDDDLPF